MAADHHHLLGTHACIEPPMPYTISMVCLGTEGIPGGAAGEGKITARMAGQT